MGRSTIWKEAKVNMDNALSPYSPRTVTRLNELRETELNNEVDVVIYILGKYICIICVNIQNYNSILF